MRWLLLAVLALIVALVLESLDVPLAGWVAVIALLVVVTALFPFDLPWN
jgi:uncharacterized membrane protein AbrB (regulator of aidB expression)